MMNKKQKEAILRELEVFLTAFSLKNAHKKKVNDLILKEFVKSKHSLVEKIYLAFYFGYSLANRNNRIQQEKSNIKC